MTRGGNDVAGELETRCAFAKPVAPDARLPSTGFRCCAGPRNDAEVELRGEDGDALREDACTRRARRRRSTRSTGVSCGPPLAPAPCSLSRAWTWRPAPNVELPLAGGCVGRDPSARCAHRGVADDRRPRRDAGAGRHGEGDPRGGARRGDGPAIRVRGADIHGQFFREIVFTYGRIDVREVH